MTIIIISLLLLASLLPHLTFTAHVNVSIVNGREAKPHSRPYMVSLQVNRQHICGGFLISDKLVFLTAAHCYGGYEILVVVGAHDLRYSKCSYVIRVKSYIPHPGYIPSTLQNDIMLLRCCRLGKTWTNGPVSARLMEAFTTTINQACCRRRWGSQFISSQMICAYGIGGSCKGDSGGPLVCGNTAVGVTSFGDPHRCNSPEHPNVYTKISAYLQWINKMEKLSDFM